MFRWRYSSRFLFCSWISAYTSGVSDSVFRTPKTDTARGDFVAKVVRQLLGTSSPNPPRSTPPSQQQKTSPVSRGRLLWTMWTLPVELLSHRVLTTATKLIQTGNRQTESSHRTTGFRNGGGSNHIESDRVRVVECPGAGSRSTFPCEGLGRPRRTPAVETLRLTCL